MRIGLLTVMLCLVWGAAADTLDKQAVYIGFDGEYGLFNSTSAQAIEEGIRVAIEEINRAGGVLGGRPLKLITKDNRSVPARGIVNLKQFAEVKDLVAVFGGRFSPVILEQLPTIHELGIVFLNAWGSADGITEHAFHPSYTFRLSLRDKYAMPVMFRHAQQLGITQVGVLAPNTGWGRSNTQAAEQHQRRSPTPKILSVLLYNWGEKDMLQYYQNLRKAGAEAIILVSNDIEGGRLLQQLSERPEQEWLPIISHWGVTGGKFAETSGPILHKLNFSVVQTFSLFQADPDIRQRVMALAQELFGTTRIEDVRSPVGFGHAYDLTHILALALELAGSTERAAVRAALEQVSDYRGLTGMYPQPFSADNHDALREEQVFMARYREDGVIVPLAPLPASP